MCRDPDRYGCPCHPTHNRLRHGRIPTKHPPSSRHLRGSVSAIDSDSAVGWRLWKVREDELCSWAVDYVWQPGENKAVCLADRLFRCPEAPGTSCRCGFWALYSPVAAIRLASGTPAARAVIGLVVAFGNVAVHGREGFRSEMAKVACLFTDEIALAPVERLWRRLRRSLNRRSDAGLSDGNQKPHTLKPVADRYGVPLISLQSAISVGLLPELGVQHDAIVELQEWLTPSRIGERGGRAELA